MRLARHITMRVSDVMNRELFPLEPDDLVDEAARYLAALGITGAPVLDADGAPMGVLSLPDCVGGGTALVVECMTTPAITIRDNAPLHAAARLIGETDHHRLVAVDANGRAVGVVSSIDVIRGLLGMPAHHPPQFPHYDAQTGLTWTDDAPLDPDRVETAPAGAGILLLIESGDPPRTVYAEWTRDLRARLVELASEKIWSRRTLWFRAAALEDGPRRKDTVNAVVAREL
jgi:CBS domain-containing protein